MQPATLPKISIITPSFNQGPFLEETILSVLQQGYPNLEYIIIDGGSTDESVGIIKRYQDRLHYWVSEKDSGQSEALNKGLRRATGDIIGWLCSDDLYLPGTFEKVVRIFEQHPAAGMLHGRSILFGKGKKELIKGAEPKDLELRYFSVIPFPQPSSFFTRTAINHTGLLDESLHFAMDYDLLIRVAGQFELLRTEEVLSKYRLHSSSKTVSQLPKFAVEWARVFSRFINSTEIPAATLNLLSSHGFYYPEEPYIEIRRTFSLEEIDRIVAHFLFNQLIIYYEVLDTKMVKRILKLIQTLNPSFYQEMDLTRISLLTKLLPPVLLQLFRAIAR